MKNWCAAVFFLLFISCNKSSQVTTPEQLQTTTSFVKYTIKKGTHFSELNNYKAFTKKELKFTVIFDSSAIYSSASKSNQDDINKLYGFSDCGTHHHENSARFGWRWNGSALELHAYWYVKQSRYSRLLQNIPIGKEVELAIHILPEHYGFESSHEIVLVPRHCSSNAADGYLLYPYFGGDESAPHDISILIKDL